MVSNAARRVSTSCGERVKCATVVRGVRRPFEFSARREGREAGYFSAGCSSTRSRHIPSTSVAARFVPRAAA